METEIYEDKVEEKKKKFMNKMEALKRELTSSAHTTSDRRKAEFEKSRIRVKILGEQIKRKREKESIKMEEKKGQKLLESLLIRSNSDYVSQTTL